VAIWLTMPQPDVRLEVGGRAFQISPGELQLPASAPGEETPSATDATIVVDVQGAVQRPGLHHLAIGSRVGDAIEAAGGYSPAVNISAAASQLNLAALLDDGSKIHVPALGDVGASGSSTDASSSAGSTGTGGLIDINGASAVELESLPGIGEVTAAKIIAAREEMPFASIEDLLGREVVGSATMDKIRELITVTP
jgi:competence protein ComEA